MKKVVLALATLAVAGVMVTAATAGGPLYVATEIPCGVYDADGGTVLTYDSQLVWFASGKVYLRCEAQVANETGRRLHFSGFVCGLGQFGTTTYSKNTIGRNGSSQLTCNGFVHPNDSIDSASSSAFGVAG